MTARFSRGPSHTTLAHMAKAHWLVKQEPDSYSWKQFAEEGSSAWTGIRNFQARNHLRAMQPGDWVLYYHTGDAKEIVGLAKVAKAAYADPTATEGDWSCVDLAPVKPLKRAVSLAELRSLPATQGMALLRQSRLSVTPVTPAEFQAILEVSGSRA